MDTRCVLCEGATRLQKHQRNFDILSCLCCGHWFVDPAILSNHLIDNYGDDYFSGGKDGYTDYLSYADELTNRGRQYARRVSKHTDIGSLLDVGAAAGFIAKGFELEGWDVTAIEPNRSMVEFGRKTYDIDISQSDFESYDSDKQYDLVSLIQVIAHMQDLPVAMERLQQLTTPSGHVLIETWNRDSVIARLSGKRWHELSPPSVLHWFSKNSLRKVMEYHGFEQIAGATTTKWISLQHAVSLLGHSQDNATLERISRKLPARLSIPYLGDDLFWALFKKK